jgi:hypothetical protein
MAARASSVRRPVRPMGAPGTARGHHTPEAARPDSSTRRPPDRRSRGASSPKVAAWIDRPAVL